MTRPCVLLVEDNPVSTRVIERFMEKADCALIEVSGNGSAPIINHAGNIAGVVASQ